MGAFTKWGRIAVAASSVAVLSMNTVLSESSKPVEQANRADATKTSPPAATPPPAAAAAQENKPAEKQSVCRKALGSKMAPKMAPQFDGLNFYETFIGSAQR